MELVPIVYTALLIVVILALITIVISFVSYKFKQRYGIVDAPTIAQPAIKVEESVKKVVKRLTKPIHIEPSIEKAIVHKEKKVKLQSHSHNEKQNHRKKALPEKEKNERIEVVKNLKPPKVNSLPPVENKIDAESKKNPAEENPKLKTLGDRIIDKYDDDSEENMYTLKIKKKKE